MDIVFPDVKEQGLEEEGLRSSGLGRELSSAQPRGGRQAAVMRYGFHRRMFFEGKVASRGASCAWLHGFGREGRTRRTKRDEPQIGSGMQQAHSTPMQCRRSGEKPQGRERSEVFGPSASSMGCVCRWGGNKPQERRPASLRERSHSHRSGPRNRAAATSVEAATPTEPRHVSATRRRAKNLARA